MICRTFDVMNTFDAANRNVNDDVAIRNNHGPFEMRVFDPACVDIGDYAILLP